MQQSVGLTLPTQYLGMLARDGHANPAAFSYATDQIFRGVDLQGKRILEIGSGRGLMALLMGLHGAAQVVSLEPELAGATAGVIALQRERIEALQLSNVDVVAADFNTWSGPAGSFDLIVSRASINHLCQSDRHALHDPVTYERYVRMARKIHSLLAPEGLFIATDACRYAFFTMLRDFGVSRPWRPARTGINWRHHQNPGTWKKIFRDAGFGRVTISFPVPHRLKPIAFLMDTAAANFFLKGSFILRAHV